VRRSQQLRKRKLKGSKEKMGALGSVQLGEPSRSNLDLNFGRQGNRDGDSIFQPMRSRWGGLGERTWENRTIEGERRALRFRKTVPHARGQELKTEKERLGGIRTERVEKHLRTFPWLAVETNRRGYIK